KTLVTAAEDALAVRDPASLRVVRRIPAPKVWPLSQLGLCADGKTVAATRDSAKMYVREVGAWEVASGKPLPLALTEFHELPALALSPDGKTLAAGAWGGWVQLWDVPTGKKLRRLPGPGKLVRALALGPGARALACGCPDGRVRIWDVAGGRSHDLRGGA